jgi:hypothetical protein
VGYPKTGTTWFQQEFFPVIRNYNLVPREVIKKLIIQQTPFNFDAASSREQIVQNFGTNIILSEELLIGSVRSGGFNLMHTEQMAYRLQAIFPEAKIVVFLRNQPDIILSAYGQYLKDGGRDSLSKFITNEGMTQMMRLRSFSWEFLNYAVLLDHYKSLFPESTYVFLYESFKNNPESFVQQFIHSFNISCDISTISFNPRNVGIENYELKRLANRLHKFKMFFPGRWTGGLISIGSILNRKKTNKQLLGLFYDEMIAYYAKSNKILMQKHGLTDVTKYNYPLDVEE